MHITAPRLAAVAQPFKRGQAGLFHGAQILSGNNVPFSKHKTRRKWFPNALSKNLYSEILGQRVRVTISARALRTVDKLGGLDNYLFNTKPELLGDEGMRLRVVLQQYKDEVKAGYRSPAPGSSLSLEGRYGRALKKLSPAQRLKLPEAQEIVRQRLEAGDEGHRKGVERLMELVQQRSVEATPPPPSEPLSPDVDSVVELEVDAANVEASHPEEATEIIDEAELDEPVPAAPTFAPLVSMKNYVARAFPSLAPPSKLSQTISTSFPSSLPGAASTSNEVLDSLTQMLSPKPVASTSAATPKKTSKEIFARIPMFPRSEQRALLRHALESKGGPPKPPGWLLRKAAGPKLDGWKAERFRRAVRKADVLASSSHS
ncbi:hypothetical protein SISNIDRAFT_450759 [Sistotremastrum niveocremeum HHB9708]|uniref:Large ribosomal subunit protein bL28m n=1 Tax=Sistotremastrum niveocremeum HHB9708 TaxID=1314777 RepID=A0A164YJE5_9AGAM|nr:hypothetical protein SISNIDRAFT_450759 [Sistotremastrum niveocremeum HHB9708]